MTRVERHRMARHFENGYGYCWRVRPHWRAHISSESLAAHAHLLDGLLRHLKQGSDAALQRGCWWYSVRVERPSAIDEALAMTRSISASNGEQVAGNDLLFSEMRLIIVNHNNHCKEMFGEASGARSSGAQDTDVHSFEWSTKGNDAIL